MNEALAVVLAGLSKADTNLMKEALRAHEGPPLFLVGTTKRSFVSDALKDADNKRKRKYCEKVLKRNPGVPLAEWNDEILSWSAGYWKGKILKGGLRKTERERLQLWHDEAFAELLKRKLVSP